MTDITIPDKETGGQLTAAEFNQLLDALKDGTRNIIPESVTAPDSDGIVFYASDGTTEIGRLDDNGNLLIKGRVLKLD